MAVSKQEFNGLDDDPSKYEDGNGINGDSNPGTSETIKAPSKLVRRRVNDSDFKYNCEWIGCTHISSSMNEFNHHVSLHRRGYTLCLGRDDEVGSAEFAFYCQWQDCNAVIEGQIEDFSRHVFYHTFHQYLKYLGQRIQDEEKLEKCLLDTASRNIIPELPEKLMCRWQDCGVVYENPYIFYSHASHHCEDYPKGNDPGVVVKCKWEGCSAVTKSSHKLKEHIRSHTQAKVIACPTCGSLFASNTRFVDHLKRQNQEPEFNFECSHCNSRFASERILREHMRHHVNHYKCPLCDMTCHSPSAVRDHVRYRHSQERGFQCSQCDYKAKSSTDMRRHSTSHVTKDTFSCTRSDCGRVFKTKKDLLEHYNTEHELFKAYECHICSKPFTRGWYLTTHLKEVHNYRWPSGHKRFRYKLHEDGIRRLQTIRYESIEVSQQILGQDLSAQSTLPMQSVASNDDSSAENNNLIVENASCSGDKNSAENGSPQAAATSCGQLRGQELSVCQAENFENLKDDVGDSGNDPAVSSAGSGERHISDTQPKNKRKSKVSQGSKAKSKGSHKRQAEESEGVNESSRADISCDSQPDKGRVQRSARKRKRGGSQESAAEPQDGDIAKKSNTWMEVFYVDLDNLK